MSVNHWLQLDPWRELQGLPQFCATKLGLSIVLVGPELEARLRDARIPSRIKPSQVYIHAPNSTYQSTSWGGRRLPAPASWPRTTSDATVEGNGGWDRVDWIDGSIEALPIEAHWPSVEAMMRDIQVPPGQKRQSRLPAEKREAVMSAMRAKIDSGEMTAAALGALPKKQLPVLFSEAETTCYEARKRVLHSLESLQTKID